MQRLLLCTLKVLRVIHATVDTVLRSHPRFHRFARILVFIALLASSFSLLCSHPRFHHFARILIFIASPKNRKTTESILRITLMSLLDSENGIRAEKVTNAVPVSSQKLSRKESEKEPSTRQKNHVAFELPWPFFLELQLVKKQPQLPNLLLCFCLSTAVLKFYSYTCRNFYELGIGAEMQHCKLFDPSIRRPWNQWWWGAWCASRFWPYFWKGKFMMMQRLFSRCTYDGPAGKYLWSAKSINWRKDSSHVQL